MREERLEIRGYRIYGYNNIFYYAKKNMSFMRPPIIVHGH